MGMEGDIAALQERLRARDAAVRKRAAQEAGERQVVPAAPRLVELLRDGNSGVAATAAWALGRLRYEPAEADLAALLHAPNQTLRKGAAWALGRLGTGSALERLLGQLGDADEPTTRSILVALDAFPDELIVPALIALLHAPSGPLRAQVTRALLRRSPAAVPALLAALRALPEGEAAVHFRRAAAHVLATTAPEEALATLLDLSYQDDVRTRLYAARGLIQLMESAPEARGRLEEMAGDERRDVAAAARSGLHKGDDSGDEEERLPLPLDLAAGLPYILPVLPGLEEVAAAEVAAVHGARVTRRLAGAILARVGGPPHALAGLHTVLDVLLFAGRLPSEAAGSGRFRDRRPVRAAIAALKAAYPEAPLTVYVHVPPDLARPDASVLREAARDDLEQAGAQVAPSRAALTAEVVSAGPERLLGIRVLAQPPGRRPRPAGGLPASLHAPLAAAMVRLTAPAADDVFLDPLCGAGTLLRERALAGPYARLIGGDADARAVALTRDNLAGVANLTVEQWDATRLPLDDASVDRAALNPPYGHRSGSHEANAGLYPLLLAELARVVRPGGLVALVTAEQRLTTALLRGQDEFARERLLPVRAGGLAVAVYLLRRRSP